MDIEIREARWAACKSCEHLFRPTSQCKRCGCFMKIKTRMSWASCPIGLWGAEDGEDLPVEPEDHFVEESE